MLAAVMDNSRIYGRIFYFCILIGASVGIFSTPLPVQNEQWVHLPKTDAATASPVLFSSQSRQKGPLASRQGHKGPAFQSLDVQDFTDIPEVQAHYKHYSGRTGQEYLHRVLRRGEAYLPFINNTVREMNLPWELAYLPIIESAFIPTAVSRSGATGLWQFMMNSIHPYNMQVNTWMDERRDFWKATLGALKKLEYNYSVLGDWLLAIGAYNCGLGGMQRAVEAAGTRNFWTLARNGYLPAETAAYVPRFLAVSRFCLLSRPASASCSVGRLYLDPD